MTRADAGMLDQVLMNLVVNARDAMPGGGRLHRNRRETIGGRRSRASESRRRARAVMSALSVSDTGSGIPPEILPRIFEPFFTTKEAGQGHRPRAGHRLWHRQTASRLDQGGQASRARARPSRFFSPHATEPAGKARPPRLHAEATRGGTETILLVEDEAAGAHTDRARFSNGMATSSGSRQRRGSPAALGGQPRNRSLCS